MTSTLSIVLIIAVIVLLAFLLLQMRRRPSTDTSETERILNLRIEDLRQQCGQYERTVEGLNHKITTLTAESAGYRAKAEGLEQNLQQQQTDHREALEQERKRHADDVKRLEEAHRLNEQRLRETHRDQLEQLENSHKQQFAQLQEQNRQQVESQLQLIKEQMQTTSETVLKQRSQELDEQNLQQVSKIIDPLLKNIRDMEKAFNEAKEKQQEAIIGLNKTIEINKRDNEKLGETADRLARALTGEVKAQGNFGELKLKQLLENLQLREGEQYDTQETLRDAFGQRIRTDEGRALIPDFILHFPNHRHVVIDAKMSLTAFERYMNLPDGDPTKSNELRNHIASVRNQVKRLASKSYSQYLPDGYNRLDFAFMYVPIDAALNLALLNDNTLWKEAYDQGVIILGPQTMYMNLRVLEMMWTQIRQLENQQDMIKNANNIVKRVQDFAKRFNDVEKSLRTAVDKFDSFKITIRPNGQSIITAAQKLIQCGAKGDPEKLKFDPDSDSNFIDDAQTLMLDAHDDTPQQEEEDTE